MSQNGYTVPTLVVTPLRMFGFVSSTDLGSITVSACADSEQTWRPEDGYRIQYISDHRMKSKRA